tara:strand:- start:60 stop:1427 length:1368 start_codon:yes stop_codon:yes gene_type:complete
VINERVRFAPSPTGFLHLGGLRTALFNFAFCKKYSGKIILRIEDTDQSRKVDGAVTNLIESLNQCDVTFDEGPHVGGEFGPYFQSQRLDIYSTYYKKLLENNDAYIVFNDEDPNLDYRKRRYQDVKKRMIDQKFVVKLRIPRNELISFFDELRGQIEFDSNLLKDPIIIKSDGYPTYHFANVVDDHEMKISHVIRGEEWLPSCPIHVLLYKYLGWYLPKFTHLPLLLNSDKSKLSKRQGDVAVESYLKKGFLPSALINFVSLLGWHPSDDTEIFSMNEMIKNFNIGKIQKGGAVFDLEKLRWMNGVYIKKMDYSYYIKFLKKHDLSIDKKKTEIIFEIVKERSLTLLEMLEESKIFVNDLDFKNEDFKVLNSQSSQLIFKYVNDNIASVDFNSLIDIASFINQISETLEIKGKDLFFPLRLAIYGKSKGPEIPRIMEALGRDETEGRIARVLVNV